MTRDTKLQRWDVEHIQFGIYRYCLTIDDVRDLLGGVAAKQRTPMSGAGLILDTHFGKEDISSFSKTAYYRCGVPFPYIDIGMQNLPHYADTNLV